MKIKPRDIHIFVIGLLTFEYLLFKLAITLKPNADDYIAHSLVNKSCKTWENYASINSENSIGFRFFSKVVFCTQNIFSTNVFLLILFIILNISFFTIFASVFNISAQKSLVNKFLLTVLIFSIWYLNPGNGNHLAYLYMGPIWTMQWLQHTLPLMLLIFAIFIFLKNKSVEKTNFFLCFLIGICITYSSLNLIYTIPLLIIYIYRVVTFSDIKSKVISISLLMFFVFVSFTQFLQNSRGFRALESQDQESNSFIRRFFAITLLSFRDLFLVKWYVLLFFILLGFLLKNIVVSNRELYFLFIYFVYIYFVLVLIETFTYYALWHRRSFDFFAYYLAYNLGVKLRGRHKKPQAGVTIIFLLLFAINLQQTANGIFSLNNYCLKWNFVIKDAKTNEWEALDISSSLKLGVPDSLSKDVNIAALYNGRCFEKLSINSINIDKFLTWPITIFDDYLFKKKALETRNSRILKWLDYR